ncbi:MAG: hypothetical protein ACYDDA_04935 [Acidiferrobacteraceae bacterium]
MGEVATTPTPLTRAQALGALLAAGVPQSALPMVAAQSAVETNAWGSTTGHGFNNYNFGNTTPSASQIAAGISWMTQGVPNMKYIAFDDPVSGAKSMLGWITSHGLLPYAENNDLAGYTAKLEAGCYLGCVGRVDPSNGQVITQQAYTNYQNGIASWMNTLRNVQPVAPPSASPFAIPVADLALAAAAALSLAGLGYLAWREYKQPGYLLPFRAATA